MHTPSVDELLDMVASAGRRAVVDAVVELAEREGLDSAIALLGAVQREVGVRWQNQSWSIADEHAATATIDLALAAAALGTPTPTPTLGSVVVACAEEEWHVLPARMFAEQLRARGWDVTFLGASTPAEHLTSFLVRRRPAAVAISCSVAIYLPGARRSIGACHAAGVPALVGGAAFGSTARRGLAIGADGVAASIDDAHRLVSEWAAATPSLAAPVDDLDQIRLAADRPAHVDAAIATLDAEFPPFEGFSAWQRAKTREDFDYILRFVEAALLTGDDNIVIDFAEWLTDVLVSRDLPRDIVPLSARCLLSSIPSEQTAARRLLELISRPGRADPEELDPGAADR